MAQPLFSTVYNHPTLSFTDVQKIKLAHEPISFAKGESFLDIGKIPNEYYLIENGLVRSYAIDYKGNEITTGFDGPTEFIIEVSSLFQRIPSMEGKVALTAGVAWKMPFGHFQELFHNIPGFPEWGRSWMSSQLFQSKQQFINIRTASAPERYEYLLKSRPELIKKVPLKYIASYLGITDTSLSRIRKEMVNAQK